MTQSFPWRGCGFRSTKRVYGGGGTRTRGLFPWRYDAPKRPLLLTLAASLAFLAAAAVVVLGAGSDWR